MSKRRRKDTLADLTLLSGNVIIISRYCEERQILFLNTSIYTLIRASDFMY